MPERLFLLPPFEMPTGADRRSALKPREAREHRCQAARARRGCPADGGQTGGRCPRREPAAAARLLRQAQAVALSDD